MGFFYFFLNKKNQQLFSTKGQISTRHIMLSWTLPSWFKLKTWWSVIKLCLINSYELDKEVYVCLFLFVFLYRNCICIFRPGIGKPHWQIGCTTVSWNFAVQFWWQNYSIRIVIDCFWVKIIIWNRSRTVNCSYHYP